jgi:3-dehydroquinate dehydratase-2
VKKNKVIKIINGANLNLLGKREPEIYGVKSFETFLSELKRQFIDIELLYFQSNIEGEILNELHNSDDENIIGIVLNAGAFTHYSIAIRDAIASISTPVVEVHISNIFSREEFRQKSVISAVCKGVISGFGLSSYTLAIRYLCETF